MAISEALPRRQQRRTFRILRPDLQLRMGLTFLALTFVFGVLFALNSYAAFGKLYDALLATAPEIFQGEFGAQARSYLYVSSAILAGYLLAVFGVCVAMVHRLVGPTVALERHVRALKLDDYSSRLHLRSDDSAYNELARHLNDLAERLEQRHRARTSL